MNEIENFLQRRPLVLLTTLLLGMAAFVYQDFLFGGQLFLFLDIGSDTVNAMYTRLVQLAAYVRDEGLPGWSFHQGMGANIFARSLGNPLEWPLFLMGAESLAYGIVWITVFKVVLGGLFFYLYLRELKLSAYVTLIGGLLYAFSGFMILGGSWYSFSMEALHLAILLYAFERYFRCGSWWLFPLVIGLIAAARPFNLYTFSVFFTFYSVFRFVDVHGLKWQALSIFLLRLMGLGILGAGLVSFFLFSNILEIVESQRSSGGAASVSSMLQARPFFSTGSDLYRLTEIMRFFSSDLLGTGSNYQGAMNYLEAPMFYGGLLTLLLFPQIFIFLKGRQRWCYATLLVIILLPVIFPYIRYTYWLFSGDYYRILSFMVTIILMLMSLQALHHVLKYKQINLFMLWTTLLLLLLALFYPYELSDANAAVKIDVGLAQMVAIFLIVYTILLTLIDRAALHGAILLVLLVAVITELSYFSTITVKRASLSEKMFESRAGYNDYTVETMAYLKEKDSSFYRVEKTYSSGPAEHISLNDAQIQNYFGTKVYHSFNQPNYLRFLESMEFFDNQDPLLARRWINGLIQRPVLLSFASVKYVLIQDERQQALFAQFGYSKLKQINDVIVLENSLVLPFGFTYDRYMTSADFETLGKGDKAIALLNAAVLEDTDIAKLEQFDRLSLSDLPKSYPPQHYRNDIEHRRAEVFEMESFSHNRIKGSAQVSETQLLFFSIPFDSGWHALIDGQPVRLLRTNIGFTGMMLYAGKHQIELFYHPPYRDLGLLSSVLAVLLYLFFLWRTRGQVMIAREVVGTQK